MNAMTSPPLERATAFVTRNLTMLILAVMVLGLASSALFGGIAFNLGICAVASFLMIYPMFVNLKVTDLGELGKFKGPVAISLVLNFVVSPALAYGVAALLFPQQPWLRLGLMLIALIPTSGMTATWTELSRGNLKVALSIIAVSLVVVIVGLPFALPVVAGGLLDAGPLFILQRIAFVIVLPLVLGDITRRLIVKRRGMDFYRSRKPVFSGLSSMGLLVVLFLIMALDTNARLLSQPTLVLVTLPALVLYYLGMFGASFATTRRLDPPVATAVVFGTSVRYLALALGIVVPLMGAGAESSQVVMVVALAFFVQVPLSSLASRWLSRRAGPVLPAHPRPA